MGEVWRARDTRLDRDVAVKVLPASQFADAQLRVRFEREARAISSLNHPNICTLFDVGQDQGVDYLVMELIEGESLAERVRKGPLPLDQVLRVGSQIATALHAAHRQGIVHRDLKPGNVMLTRSGAKLLDFGLAKSEAGSGISESLIVEATAMKPLTREGTIVGTFQYMAPEQLEGLGADARTDIFALGCVLYEMATGKRAFDGSSKTSLIAAIVSSHPAPIASLSPATPPALDHVVSKCLAKDPEDRWQSAHDVAAELQWIGNASSDSAIAPLPARHRAKRERLAWAIAGLAIVAALAGAAMIYRMARAPREVLRVSLAAPPGTTFDFTGQSAGSIVLSPDGRELVVELEEPDTSNHLWVRSLATGQTRKISGSAGGKHPFWSPDSRFVAFFASGKLMKAELNGAPPVVICDAPSGRGGTWSEGTILFAPNPTSAIFRVAASGGVPQPVTKVDAATEFTHRWPSFLPDGRRFLYLATQGTGIGARGTVWLASLDKPGRKALLPSVTNAAVSAGHLLFVREGVLLAQRIDLDDEALTGDPVPIASSVNSDSGSWRASFSATEGGKLAYRSGAQATRRTVTVYDAKGAIVHRVPDPAGYATYTAMAFSPDSKRLALEIADPKTSNDDLWLLELERGIRTRLTMDPAGEYLPNWSRDGSRIAFSRAEAGKHWFVVVKDLETGVEKPVFAPPNESAWVTDWSPDGRFLACTVQESSGKRDVVIVPVDGGAPQRVLAHPYEEANPSFSPDGKWLSYVSKESGTDELYLTSWPSMRGKWQISTNSLQAPRLGFWSGEEVRYIAPDGTVMAVHLRGNGSSVDIGAPRPMFSIKGSLAVAISRDGTRVASAFPFEENNIRSADVVELVVNWDATLADRSAR